MEGNAVFLPILCSFLNGHWTSACYSDNDCLYAIQRCCKVGHFEGKGSCVNQNLNCNDFCDNLGDCSAPERCDIYNNLCTTACSITTQCHQGYICDDGRCIWDEESEESELNITTLIAVIVGLGALLFLVCCCMKHNRRSDQRNTASGNGLTNRATGGSTPRQNGDVDRLQMRTNIQGDEESGVQIPDPIAEGGPPAYSEISAQPESPPPSYEEVMNASHEVLPPNVQEHQHEHQV